MMETVATYFLIGIGMLMCKAILFGPAIDTEKDSLSVIMMPAAIVLLWPLLVPFLIFATVVWGALRLHNRVVRMRP